MISSKKLLLMFLVSLFLLHISICFGQDTIAKTSRPEVKSLNKISIYFPGVALEREQKISRTSTISLGINYQFTFLRSYYILSKGYYANGTLYYGNPKLEHTSKLKALPGASINYRYYYRLDKRAAKNKNTSNNSASYLSMDVASIFPRLSDKSNQYDYQLSITPNWGIQRNVAKTANGEFAIGPSIIINPYETLLGVGLKAGFSFLF